MPASTKLQEKYGEDVQVIFVECQNTPKDTWEAFAWKMKWMGNRSMWTTERPIPTVGKGLPEVALIGVDGEVVLQGYPGDFGKKFDEAVEGEIKKSKEPPAGTPKELKKAWQLFHKGDVAGALAECEKVGGDDALKAKDEFVARTTARVGRAKWLIDGGHITSAEKLLEALEKGVKADAELAPKVAEQKTRLASAELAQEREADKAFSAFVADVAKKKPFEEANVKRAQQIATKHKGTKAAVRAERFVTLSKVKLEK
ncbi:MAG: hypothetical protein ACKVXR_06175 [Planctomycetota bacterium]